MARSLIPPTPRLALTAEQGYGYFPATPGLTLKDGRYEVSRMLGSGEMSSVFLVHDMVANRNYALKILTARATSLNRQGRLRELKTLQEIAALLKSDNPAPFLPELVDHFETTGPHGDHLCFVLRLRSTDASSFRRTAPSHMLLLHDVKMIVLHALYALKMIHGLGLIHTDVKASDMLLFPGVEDIVTPIIEGEIELQGRTYPILKAQPLPHTFRWDDKYKKAESRLFCLNDVGHAIGTDWDKNYELGTPYALRAPEIILRAGYDAKIDIWAIGCMAFELLTGCWALNPEGGERWDIDEDHLAKMLQLTGETFDDSMLARSELRDKFFSQNNKLRHRGTIKVVGIHQLLITLTTLPPKACKLAAEFITACLHLDPSRRPTANELVGHPWLEGADWCIDYQKP